MIPDKVEARFERLRPALGAKLDALRQQYLLDAKSRPEIELLLERLEKRAFGNDRRVGVPPVGRVNGAYRLGDVLAGSRPWGKFGLREDEWIQHLGIFGRTGSGKTNVGFLVLREFVSHKKPFLVFDWKRNYRDLVQRPEFSGLKVYTVGRDIAPFHFNPLLPPRGCDLRIFLKKLIEILMHVYWLGDGVAYLLQKAIDAVFRETSVYSGKGVPTMADVRGWLRSYKARGREGQWMDSTRRVIETLCFGQIGRVVTTGSNDQFERILKSQAVLELDALSNSDKTFLIESILAWLHLKRVREGSRETFKHALVIEEAHHVLLRRPTSKETVMDVIFREIRELGESLIFLDQHPSLVSVPSRNSYCTVAMNVKHGNDVSALGRAMLLSDDEKNLLGQLEVGEALVKLQGRWVKPFIVRFPLLPVKKGTVRDSDLKRRDPGVSGSAAEIRPAPDPLEEVRAVRASDRDKARERISSDEAEVLGEVAAHPVAGVSSRIARLGMSSARFYKTLEALLSRRLATASWVSTLRGRKRILVLTATGADAIRAENPPLMRNETPEHWYWKHWIADRFRRKGANVEVECDGADIAVTNGTRLAVEVETGMSDAQRNVERNLAAGFDRVVVVWLRGDAPVSNAANVEHVTLRSLVSRLSEDGPSETA